MAKMGCAVLCTLLLALTCGGAMAAPAPSAKLVVKSITLAGCKKAVPGSINARFVITNQFERVSNIL